MARVSVVVSTSNSRDALMSTVDTVLGQGFSDFELLVTDDGSSDGTGVELLTRLGPDPSRVEQVWRDTLREDTGTRSIQMLRQGILIHYLHQVNARGLATARNRAVGCASGEFLAFAEAGDLWRPRKMRAQVDLLDTHTEVAACLEPVVKRGSKKGTSRKRPQLLTVAFDEVLDCPGLRLNGAVLRRTCLDGEVPFDENLPGCEDYDFWLRIASRFPIGRLEETLQQARPPQESTEWGQERFRVYALEKAYQSGNLSPTMRHRVAEELIRQCDHLVDGYRSRENHERANFYDRKRKRFSSEVAKLDLSDPVFSGSRSKPKSLSGAPL